MKTKTITLYSFDELSEEGKKKAIENLSDINVDYEWWESTYDDFKNLCAYFGIEVDLKKTYFSGFSHQGQGSSYTADVDVCKLVQCIKAEAWKEYAPKERFNFQKVTANIERACKLIPLNFIDGHCIIEPTNRETSVKIHFSYSIKPNSDKEHIFYNNVSKAIDDLNDFVSDACEELNNWFFRSLEREHDYQTSEESIIETIKANEYTFTENGDLENE